MTALSDEIDAMIAEHGGRVRDALNIAMARRDALRAELADVRAQWEAEIDAMVRDWQSDVGTLTARAQTAEDAQRRAEMERSFMMRKYYEIKRANAQRRDAARKVARYAAQATASMGAMEEQVKDARAEAANWRELADDLGDTIGHALQYASGETERILRAALRGPAQSDDPIGDELYEHADKPAARRQEANNDN